jgi:methylated-DNA-[protein]-cysteine S-methyltransferase
MDQPVAIRTTLAGPWGPVHVAATDRGVVAVEWLTTDAAFDAELSRRLGGSVASAKGRGLFDRRERHLATGVKAVETFLAGRPPKGDVSLDLRDRPDWDRKVLGVVAAIPWGKAISYGEVARRIGVPRASRAVGGALGRNPISFLIPCHRVIAADGSLGGWGGDRWGDLKTRLAMKESLLLREGVHVVHRAG